MLVKFNMILLPLDTLLLVGLSIVDLLLFHADMFSHFTLLNIQLV